MMQKGGALRDLYIFGVGQFAEVARFYFEKDDNYRVKFFCVDAEYVSSASFEGVDVISVEELEKLPKPSDAWFFVAVGYSSMNDVRRRNVERLADFELKPASYISPAANVLTNQDLSKVRHLFILEGNVIQYGTKIGQNVVLWSGNHLGHHSTIGENSFLSSHVTISGNVTVGAGSFLGVNSTVADGVSIGPKCFVGAGAIVSKDLAGGSLVVSRGNQKIIENGAIFI